MYKIEAMKKENIPTVIDIWHDQFNKYCGDGLLPGFFPGGVNIFFTYLEKQIENGNALIAEKNGKLSGYMTWLNIDFHNEAAAFCPTIGHAALLYDEEIIYRELYTAASRIWVLNHRFNHLWMTFYRNRGLQDLLYDFGFGSYVVDACRKITLDNLSMSESNYVITKATLSDADDLQSFANDTQRYYSDAPIFLKLEVLTKEKIVNIISNQHALLAWNGRKIIGVMNYTTDVDYHFERLTSHESARVAGIGGFIIPEYRGIGIGSLLVQEMFNRCYAVNKPFVHVSFESSNPYAMRFWPKYFTPVIRSVRRTVNKDAN